MSKLPPMNALRAFESAARLSSISRAADELLVTPGAVSKQLKILEESLGKTLAKRSKEGVTLTSEGLTFFQQITGSFENIRRAVSNIEYKSIAGQVTVSCMPSFASHWLVPRLSEFLHRYEDVVLTILNPELNNPLANRDVDIAIHFGRPTWSDLDVRLLKQMAFFPVCSPVLINRTNQLSRNSDLLKHTLLDGARSSHWHEWFALNGELLPKNARRVYFEDFNQNLAAARAGLGVALGDNVTTAHDLDAGRLLRPVKGRLKPRTDAYYLLTRTDEPKSKSATAFLKWIIKEAGPE